MVIKITIYILIYMSMKAYEILVDQIVSKLEQWLIPWKKSWVWWIPFNYVSNKSYRWFNKLVLSLNEFEDNRYITMKQVKNLWWSIREWSKWTKIYFFKINESKENNIDSNNTTYKFPMIRYYTVFNIEQTQWIDIEINKSISNDNSNLYKAQEIVSNYIDKPIIKHGLNASYNLLDDIATIPSLPKFKSNEEYFSTLFHELVHSTWNENRLSRFWLKEVEYFGSERYSKEELVAELGSMFLCMEAWIQNNTKENSINYIAWWLKYIKWNKKDLITASIQAEKAVDYIRWTNIS